MEPKKYKMDHARRGLAIIMANFLTKKGGSKSLESNAYLVDKYEEMYRKMGFIPEDIIKSTELKSDKHGDVYIETQVSHSRL